MTYRELMERDGGNMDWCRPYESENGRIKLSVNEGDVCSLLIDEEDIYPITPEEIERAARIANKDYEEYDHDVHDDLSILLDASKELDCRNCPFNDICDVMGDEAPDWEEDVE